MKFDGEIKISWKAGMADAFRAGIEYSEAHHDK